jgi:hypothetical protein
VLNLVAHTEGGTYAEGSNKSTNKMQQLLADLFESYDDAQTCISQIYRLRVFENRVLRRIFGTNRDEVTGEWRKLHKEELNDLYCSPNIVQVIKLRRMKWVGHVACMGERICEHRGLVKETTWKTQP